MKTDTFLPTLRGKLPPPVRRTARALRRLARDPRARRELPARAANRLAVLTGRHRPPVMPDLPAYTPPQGHVLRPDLRVAVILDRFSTLALRYEWDQVPITPQGWRAELAEDPPALLFVESAWNGNDDRWRLTVQGPDGVGTQLAALVEWCRQHAIPTVFWNKEDPPNYDHFIGVARLFDHVFTVDANRLPDYRRDLGHDRVALLPFGAQPWIHNPVRDGARADHEVVFAGSYFTDKHPERREQMDHLLGAALAHDLHIYARKPGSGPQYRFPPHLERRIVGTVPYEQMLSASHAYKVFLNVNSVVDSPTMCARRLFELSAAQAAVLSGPAASIEPFFGDDVPVAHDRADADRLLRHLLEDPEQRDRQALRAHRRVFDQHLYRHRVDEVLRTVGLPTSPVDQSVSAIMPVLSRDRLAQVLGTLAAQDHDDLEVVVLTCGFDAAPDEVERALEGRRVAADRVVVRRTDGPSATAPLELGVEAASGRYVAMLSQDDLYAHHYLKDLVRAFEYTDAQVVGKRAHYAHLPGAGTTVLRWSDSEHTHTDRVLDGTLLTTREVARDVLASSPDPIGALQQQVRRQGGTIYAADRFGYVAMPGTTPDASPSPTDHVAGSDDPLNYATV